MFRLLVASCLVAAMAASQCSYESNDISAQWQVVNGELTIQFINKNIGNNQWTGIAFGDNMSNLEVVLFLIENNRVRMQTGYTRGYGPPTLDSSANVAAQSLMYNSNQLSARIVRPLGANGPRQSNLSQCSTWNIITEGPIEDGEIGYHSSPVQIKVCPRKCHS